MTHFFNKSLIAALSFLFITVAGTAQATDNPFGMSATTDQVQLAGNEDKCGTGKCGEGKCGGSMKKESADDNNGKCGGAEKKESKCGSGKCGGQ